MLRRLLDPDPPNAGGGIAEPPDKPATSPEPDPIPVKEMEKRLERARAAERKAMEAELKASGRLLDEDQAKQLAEEREAKQLAEEAKIKKAIPEETWRDLQKKHEAELAERDKRIADTETKHKRSLIEKELALALAGQNYATGVDGKHVEKLLWDDSLYDVDDGIVIVKDAKGNLRYAAAGGAMTMKDYVTERLHSDLSFYLAPQAKNGTAGGTLRGQQMTLPAGWDTQNGWEQLTPEQQKYARELKMPKSETADNTFQRRRANPDQK